MSDEIEDRLKTVALSYHSLKNGRHYVRTCTEARRNCNGLFTDNAKKLKMLTAFSKIYPRNSLQDFAVLCSAAVYELLLSINPKTDTELAEVLAKIACNDRARGDLGVKVKIRILCCSLLRAMRAVAVVPTLKDYIRTFEPGEMLFDDAMRVRASFADTIDYLEKL